MYEYYLLKTVATVHDNHQTNFKVTIMEGRLFIRTKHISPPFILCQEMVMQTENYSIPFNTLIGKTLTIPTVPPKLRFIMYISENYLM